MPKLANGRVPKMRRKLVKGRPEHPGYAVVAIAGKEVQLGRWDDPEAEIKYNETIANWLNGTMRGESTAKRRTVAEVCKEWVAHAEEYYRKNGKMTSEAHLATTVTKGIVAMFGSMQAEEFGVDELEAMQKYWIRQGSVRTTVNAYTNRAKQMFRWAAKRKYLSGAQYAEIALVESIGKGRNGVKDAEPVGPAPEESIRAIIEHGSLKLATMVQLQRVTGMRPGELCMMRACDIDRSGEIWIYTPEHHKTEHHDQKRPIAIGPKAQAILGSWIDLKGSNPKAYLFSDTGEKPLSLQTYRDTIDLACNKQKVNAFTPNQLRHSYATEILNDEDYDIKDAQVVLGHASYKTTERYAKQNLGRAANVAAKLG